MCVMQAFVDHSGPLLQYVCPDDRPAINHPCHRGSHLKKWTGIVKSLYQAHTKTLNERYHTFEIYETNFMTVFQFYC